MRLNYAALLIACWRARVTRPRPRGSGISRVTITLALLYATAAFAQDNRNVREEQRNPLGMTKQVIEAGQKRFKAGCAMCHGAYAEGGRGPALVNNWDLIRMSDGQLFRTIEHGIPGTGMPPSNLPEQNAWEVAAFVRSLSSPASQSPIDGNAQHGRELFLGAGKCSSCHSIHGQGGTIAPDLTDAGSMTLNELRESILDPSKEITPGFPHVKVELADGQIIDGLAKENSDYSISVLDLSGHLHELSKASARSIVFFRESLMPQGIGQQLGPAGVNDVLAFLAEQLSRPQSARDGEQHTDNSGRKVQ